MYKTQTAAKQQKKWHKKVPYIGGHTPKPKQTPSMKTKTYKPKTKSQNRIVVGPIKEATNNLHNKHTRPAMLQLRATTPKQP